MADENVPRSALDLLLESTPSLQSLETQLVRAAESEAPILVLGEPGTGRTRLARALHECSRRAGRPLIEVDPSTVPSSLFESELFGYAAGAFTGAGKARTGLVARAEGGTLLLDHVEELPYLVQPKLLRLLAENQYAPLGDRERSADVRFIAVGESRLLARVEHGSFRQDLYYRLEVLAFELPPLRRRRGDLGTLARSIVVDLAERQDRPVVEIASSTLDWMGRYRWPGNIRELRNLIERALVLHGDGELVIPPPERSGEAPPRSLEQVEREAIQRALEYCRGRKGRAAELLGISRKSLWEKRKRLGLP